MLSVSLFGRMCVKVDDRRVALTFGPRTRLFAGYLFEFPDRIHRRERLSDMFWDDLSPSAARAALNTALWRLRKLLAFGAQSRRCQFLQSRGDEVVLESSPLLRIDTHVFDGAVANALETSMDVSHKSRAATLQLAAAGYAGSFLDGDDVDWVVAERERLHSLYIRCLCELMRACAARDDYESAIAAGRRILAADQFRETVMRSLAILLFLNGQRARAIEELVRWQAALRAQVGVSALPETRELHVALVSGSISDDLTRWRNAHLPPAP
jgi:DNA-binding SARP family transcriptional activator